MREFGWLYHLDGTLSDSTNPPPIGFTKHIDANVDDKSWLGLNCAACHTSELTVSGERFRVDGGAAQLDFGQFLVALRDAVQATRDDVDKRKRFKQRLVNQHSNIDYTDLSISFEQFATRFIEQADMRKPKTPAGPARLDAMGQILNSLSVFFTNDDRNFTVASAPVSYPQLWYAPHLKWVQWNGSGSDALTRNIGQVMGVFGDADLLSQDDRKFTSSALVPQLVELESLAAKLRPPIWDETVFGKINRPQAIEGKKLFDNDCRNCHNMPPFTMTGEKIDVTAVNYKDIETDPLYIENVLNRAHFTGELENEFGGQSSVSSKTIFNTLVSRITSRARRDQATVFVANSENQSKLPVGGSDAPRLNAAKGGDSPSNFTALKAGQLEGIWATGPYLHNGSVRTLYDLLSPAAERATSFYVGSAEFDTKLLGFTNATAQSGFLLDTRLQGNSRCGHEYPERGYNDAEKMAVIEYLKNPQLPELMSAQPAALQALTPPNTHHQLRAKCQ